MALLTQVNEIVRVRPQFNAGERHDVVNVEWLATTPDLAATLAGAVIALLDDSGGLLPFGAQVEPLSPRRNSSLPSWVMFFAEHMEPMYSVDHAGQPTVTNPGLPDFLLGLFTQRMSYRVTDIEILVPLA
jgi:hypothetical protein